MPEEAKSGTIAEIRLEACGNGVEVILETMREGIIGKFMGPSTTKYVAQDMASLEEVLQRCIGNEKVTAALSRCFEGKLAAR